MSPGLKAQRIKRLGHEIGLDRIGIVRAGPVRNSAYYRRWLQAGHAGSMTYLHRNVPFREDPSRLLPGARSIICAAMSYRRPPESAPASPNPTGRVAQYARGRDYHVVLRRRLEQLIQRLRAELDEPFDARVFVDTGPLLERELAAAAGIGWIGKNTLVLHPTLGSYFVLGEILTTLELEPDQPATDHCGTCTRCLEACPTGAFPAPYQMNATRCIAYWTIEHRGEIPPELHPAIGDWVFGCDVCQEVCPYNRDAPPAGDPELASERLPARLDLFELLELRSSAYKRLVRGTAARRATRTMWQRNARIALQNALRAGPSPGNPGQSAAMLQAGSGRQPVSQTRVLADASDKPLGG